jgi:hypothetical protein
MTVEYELTGGDGLRDVSVSIPYAGSEPSVSSSDATYDVSGDILEWNIGAVDEDSPSGSFEFEAEASDENEFFPMTVRFQKESPLIEVDVSSTVANGEISESLTFLIGLFRVSLRNERGGCFLERCQVYCRKLSDRVDGAEDTVPQIVGRTQ